MTVRSGASKQAAPYAIAHIRATRCGAAPTPAAPAELIADTGYHSRAGLKALEDSAWTTRISEKQQKGFARWHGDGAARRAVYNNRARLKSRVARAAFKLRGEKVERSFAQILVCPDSRGRRLAPDVAARRRQCGEAVHDPGR